MSPQPKRPGEDVPADKPADKPDAVQQPQTPVEPAPAGPGEDTSTDNAPGNDYGGQDAGADPVFPGDAKFGPADGYPDDAYIDLPHESGDADPQPLTYDDLGEGKRYVPGQSEQTIAADLAGAAGKPPATPPDATPPKPKGE